MNAKALWTAVLFLTATPSLAGTWRYDFAPGKTYRYGFSSDSKLTAAMPMMGTIENRVHVETEYALKVEKKLPDGRYDVEIELSRLVIDDAQSGRKVTLTELPTMAKKARAYVSSRGRFQFYERVVLEVQGEAYAIGKIETSPAKASSQVTASDGEEEVTLVAAIDFKTGKATASVQKRKAQKKQQAEERPAQKMELFPVQILSMMEVPEAPVVPGMTEELEAPNFKVLTTALRPAACGPSTKCGVLAIKTTSEMNTGKAIAESPAVQAAAASEADDETESALADDEGSTLPTGMPSMAGMPGTGSSPGMGGMPGMGSSPGMGAMPGMPSSGSEAAAGAAVASSEMDTSLEAKLLFNEKRGDLYKVSGKSRARTSMMGMSMTDETTFELRTLAK